MGLSDRKRSDDRPAGGLAQFLHDNSLSLAFLVLFAVCLAGQAWSGLRAFNDTQTSFQKPPVSLWSYLATGNFLDGIMVNWQAAILQLGMFVTLGTILVQRGAAHSKDPDHPTAKPHLGHLRRARSFLHDHSLSIAMFACFILTFVLHLFVARASENESRVYSGSSPVGVLDFAVSAKFWFLTLQSWEAEFMAIGLYLVFSIFLRQKGSPESKPPDAPDEETGKTDAEG